jgi:hypothetical protein
VSAAACTADQESHVLATSAHAVAMENATESKGQRDVGEVSTRSAYVAARGH